MRSKGFVGLWTGAALIAALGCVSTQTGEAGLLEFSYVTDDDVRDFAKPIAVGAKLELTIREAGTGGNRDVTVESADTGNEAVLKVAEQGGKTIVIEATGAGNTDVSVTAQLKSNGTSVTDQVNMRAAVPEVLKLWHTCQERAVRTGQYLVNSRIVLPFEMKLNNGENVIGYGYYPVSAEPMASLTLDDTTKAQAWIPYTTGEATGDVVVTSTIDTESVTLKLVTEAEIDGAKVAVAPKLQEGEVEAFVVLPTVGSEPVCQAATDFTIESLTPEVCKADRLTQAPTTDVTAQYGWVSIEGVTPGTCKFQVSYPKGMNGEGVTQELEVSVGTR